MAQYAIYVAVNALERAIGSEQVKFDKISRLLYSRDASNYQILPIGVTHLRNTDDVFRFIAHRTNFADSIVEAFNPI